MGNLSHDRCYGTDKTTQKSGYGELTNILSPLGGEGQGEGENTPTLSLPPLRGRMKVGGRNKKSSLSHRRRWRE